MLAILLIGAIVFADQISKFFVLENLRPVGTIPVLQDVFHWTYTENTGAAFSMLSGQKYFLIVLPILICFVLGYLLFAKKIEHKLGRCALVFLLGGAIGNLIDRIVHGFVVDFIDVRIINFAIFNVADIFVTVGAGLLIAYLIFFYDKVEENNDE